jgi:hypothetical protein
VVDKYSFCCFEANFVLSIIGLCFKLEMKETIIYFISCVRRHLILSLNHFTSVSMTVDWNPFMSLGMSMYC